ncbi:MAG TPA: RNase adapter RapZ [Desulfobacteraceae bacterium]|nr:RNase adapter RapZ [Desulfobacteraceae bacterium]
MRQPETAKKMKIVIITGLSGSGKSTAIAAFEDAGYYCVDNMPIALLPKFLELPIESISEIRGLAFVMDLREKNFMYAYPSVFESLRQKNCHFEVLFLDADDRILLQRYSQTRRQHPLAQDKKSLTESIRAERNELKSLREIADRIIDTSHYNVHKLKALIRDIAEKGENDAPMRIHILSFGFKYGIPQDADLMVDVRFLPNPYFVPELKSQNGRSREIKEYIFSRDESCTFLKKYSELIDYLIPLYEKEGKAYLTLAIGCTGGMHRSVAVAEAIFEHLQGQNKRVEISHRDIEQG